MEDLDETPKPVDSLIRRIFKALSGLFQHTAVLLLLGFILTGVIGSALTSAWQSNSWITQQSLLANQRILDQKYELASNIAKNIGETHAAPTSLLLLFTNEDTPQNRRNELPKRIEYWRQTHRDWLINNNVLLQKITVYVRNPKARTTFQEIIQERKETSNSMVNLLLVMEAHKGERVPTPLIVSKKELDELFNKFSPKGQKDLNAKAQPQQGKSNRKQLADQKDEELTLRITYFAGSALFHLNEANTKAKDLMQIMAEEIREDSIPPPPQGFWSVLSRVFGFGTCLTPARMHW